MNIENFYNLAFGDYDEISGEINDHKITNNGDSLVVLATVASTVYALQTNILILGFSLEEAQMLEHVCIAWE